MSREALSAAKLALLGRQLWETQGEIRNAEPIAIIGMGCRLPGGVNSPEQFWELLRNGTDAVREVPPDRWDAEALYDPDQATPARMSTRWGGFLDDARAFDAAFFGITPSEADRMDPQHRIALEVACEAIENAGIPLDSLRGSDAGVFFSVYHADYALLQYGDLEQVSARTLTGSLHAVLANRISYVLGLHGPSLIVDSACSSSLVGLHHACQALRGRDCSLAVVGGVNLNLTPHVTVALSKGGFMSPTGRCRTFDAGADGFVRAEGCGAVVVKRLADALADGDPVLAVIRATAVNQDGESTTLSAPNGLAQEQLVRRALRNAGVTPHEISFIETHGTGTELGDPIETDALGAVFRDRPDEYGPCYLGSLKANVGHPEAAAGVTGLIKATLCLRHAAIPPQPLFTKLNPHISFDGTPFRIATEEVAWPDNGRPRLAGVSSFGVGGTNAHVILEEAPHGIEAQPVADEPPFLLPLSARHPDALRSLCASYAELIRREPDLTATICRSAAVRKTHNRPYRTAVAAPSAPVLADRLEALANGDSPELAVPGPDRAPGICFVFSGQGTQWPEMGRELMEREPVFRASLERIDALYAPLARVSLIEEMARHEDSALHRTDLAQVAIFAVQVALTDLLASWGVRASTVMGHSVGELAAAHACGMLTLEDALAAVHVRSSAMQATFDSGRMLSVRATEQQTRRFLDRTGLELSIGAVNAPSSVVLSGATEQIEAARRILADGAIETRPLDVRFGFHSHLMEDAAREIAALQIAGTSPRIPFISTVTGESLEAFDGGYLARNVLSTVRFAAAVDAALASGIRHFVEIGPHPVLGRPIHETAEAAEIPVEAAFALHRERDAAATIAALLARLHVWGVDPAWRARYPGRWAHVQLPAYPWQHRQHWLPEPATSPVRRQAAPRPTAFPGRRLRSPALEGTVFELDLADPVFRAFDDHRIAGRPRVPGTAIAELMRTAGEAAGVGATVRDIAIHQPIELEGGGLLQVIVNPGPGSARCEVYLSAEDADWALAASGSLSVDPGTSAVLDIGSDVAGRSIPTPDFYEMLRGRDCEFGPAFRLLEGIRVDGEYATGRLSLASAQPWNGTVSPAVTDACAQLCIALLAGSREFEAPGTWLPWTLDCYTASAGGQPDCGAAVLRELSVDGATFDVSVLDSRGVELLRLDGWRLRRGRRALPPLRTIEWEAKALAPPDGVRAGLWLLAGEADELAEGCAAALRETGCDVERIVAADVAPALDGSPDGILFIARHGSTGSVLDGAEQDCQALIALAQSLGVTGQEGLRLLVVTRGTQPVGSLHTCESPAGGAVWGLARSIRAEIPGLRCTSLDLDASATVSEAVRHVLAEAQADVIDAEVAVRGGERSVALTSAFQFREREPTTASPAEVIHASAGTLDGFSLRRIERPAPAAGQVGLRVLAAGLNFKDVLSALDTYPGEGSLGHECCGEVVEVGEGVTSVREGDRVLAFWPGGFATHVVVPAGFVFRAPAALEPVSCATIPIAFGTAWHALHEIAQLRQGQSVLVHAGAGGVGLAAIRIAQEAGTEVYATAGSARKREILLEMGVVAAFDSRSAEFEKHLLEATAGQGVDVVLNSLIGELIPAGLRSLRSGGAFIELGKREILSEDELRSVRDDVRYVAFDLRQEAEADASLLPRIAGELCTRFESGRLVPLPATVYPLSEAGSAFRRMARAEHVGKIVLVPHGSAEELADGWCVVTGGTGALGLATVRWLADRGVRRISVLARRGETEEARPVLDSIREGDVEVRVTAVDVSDSRQTELVLDELRATGTPIRGVFHAAGVLDDGTLAQLTPDRLRRVLLPKLAGGWNLHRATLGDPLRAFVLYSAIGPVVDGAGQASYAAANGALDALAAFRRALGLPAVSIIWGPWDGTGMAARLDERRRRHWEELGLGWWSPEDGAGMLDAALATDYPVVIASRLARRAAEPTGVVTEQTKGAQHGLIGRLGALPLHGRLPALQQHVRQCVTSVLGHPEPVDPFRPLREIGLDSLSAIELRNALTVSVGQSLPATLAFDCPTADAIARFLADRIPGFEMHVPAAAAEPAAEDADIVFIESLSEDAAEALLLEELESLREEQRAPAAEPRA